MAAAAICASEPLSCLAGEGASKSQALSLDGDWQVAKAGTKDWFPAKVPGCIHTDLMAAGKIADPFYRDNVNGDQWVGETNWVYRRSFHVPKAALKHDRVLLRCEGLDTLASIKINGQDVGTADNMFRTWEFDVKSALKAGKNSIEVLLTSPMPLIKERDGEKKLYNGVPGRSWVRKEPCSFGWDWAPVLATSGIWRNISIQTFDQARLDVVRVSQDHSTRGKVDLRIDVEAQLVRRAPVQAVVSVNYEDKPVAKSNIALRDGQGSVILSVSNPKLWWPAGMGAQPLYNVHVDLVNEDGRTLDSTDKRIGLRVLKLYEKTDSSPLHFEVNGVPFFAKGANWIPSDSFAARVTTEKLRRYVADAAAVNMNMLRFWGGGYYEEDALYDACDEMGICVWLDFKFACASYPAFDDSFMNNVRHEARDNLRRLAQHPCIAVWCGNNEITWLVRDKWGDNNMSREGYDRLFKDLLGDYVKELSPDANFVTGSPDCGDVHYWDVWWGDKTFEAYRKLNGFMSEFGFQSYPEPKSVRAFTAESDRTSVKSPVMECHERADTGLKRIENMIGNYFRPATDFDSTLWLSQIVQGYGIKTGAEAWRRDTANSTGCLFWQYNDCWPAISWASVDYYGRWKALHYMARHFYAPLLVSGLENSDTGAVEVFITSDRMESTKGTLSWNVTDLQGRSLQRDSETVEIPARNSQKIKTVDLSQQWQSRGKNNILVWLNLQVDGQVVSENLVTLVRPKELNLSDPGIKLAVRAAGDGFIATLTAGKPALWAWLHSDEMDATYSNNFFHLTPNAPVEIHVRPSQPMSQADFAKAIKVRSLFDICPAI